VVGPVVLPLGAETGAERRLVGGVVEHVVNKPQCGVRHRVVGIVEDVGGNVEHAYTRPAHVVSGLVQPPFGGCCGGFAVSVGQRGAHPQGFDLGGYRTQSGNQAATAAPGVHGAVVPD